jgi:hypothetical protein
LRLTSYHNLSALVTCHTLYVVFTTWQSAVFLLNSRLTHFTATLHHLGDSRLAGEIASRSEVCLHCRRLTVNHQNGAGYPFFRSYGARLPSSLTRFHSRALAQLCPPTCVGFRYGQPWEHLVGFLDASFNRSASAEASTSLLLRADRHFQPTACLYSHVTTKLNHSRCRNIKPAVHRLRPSAST